MGAIIEMPVRAMEAQSVYVQLKDLVDGNN
jgi:hypothetical protein